VGLDGVNGVGPRAAAPLPVRTLPNVVALTGRLLDAGSGEMARLAQGIESAPPAPMSAIPQTLGSVQMLVALAAVAPSEERRRAQVAEARRGLDVLDRLHHELLSGAAKGTTLDALSLWLKQRPDAQAMTADDPKLAALFDEIELRVRVELAKFDIEA
jgi:Class II flagellar assembly regulator